MKARLLVGWHEFNDARASAYSRSVSSLEVPNGIACPLCEAELVDSSPLITLTSNPPRKDVRCPSCGFASTRVA